MFNIPINISRPERGVFAVLSLNLMAGVVLCLLLAVGPAFGQTHSQSFRMTGAVVPGGGTASSAESRVTSTMPTTGGGTISAAGLADYAGFVTSTFGVGGTFLAYYASDRIDTVEIASRTLRVEYGGGTGPVSGELKYRAGGNISYATIEVDTTGTDSVTVTIPVGEFSLRGLEYYFRLTRGSRTVSLGDSTSPYFYVVHTSNNIARRPDATPVARYRIVGVPLQVTGSNDVTAVFEDDLGSADPTRWRLGSYSTAGDSVAEFPNAMPVVPGQGYWLITDSHATYGADGYTVMPNRYVLGKGYYEVSLARGWNQVANPFPFDVDWREVTFDYLGNVVGHDSSLIDDDAYWFSGYSYLLTNTLQAWDGFFVFTKRSGLKILFPYRELTNRTARPSARLLSKEAPPADWAIEVRLEADGYSDDGNFIGVSKRASQGVDDYDRLEPPPAPGAARLAFQLPDEDRYFRRCDIRPPFEAGETWLLDITPGTDRNLSFSGIDQLPDNFSAVLILDVGETTLLTEGVTVTLPSDTRSARLIIGDRGFTEEEIASVMPQTFELYQNFPNPFNPYTTIRFAIPEPEHVTLEVYNLLGQRVVSLVNGQMAAGTHTVVWNGIDSGGRQVATGVYFYRISAGPHNDVKKMILLK